MERKLRSATHSMKSNLKTDRRLCAWGIDLGMCAAVSHFQRIRQTRALKRKTKDCTICETGKRPNQSAPPIFASKNYKIETTPTKAALKFGLTHGKQRHSNSMPKHSKSIVEVKIEREKPMLKTILKHKDTKSNYRACKISPILNCNCSNSKSKGGTNIGSSILHLECAHYEKLPNRTSTHTVNQKYSNQQVVRT